MSMSLFETHAIPPVSVDTMLDPPDKTHLHLPASKAL